VIEQKGERGGTVGEPKGRGAAWTEERSDEGRRRLESAPEASGETG
jgi:hypothetical protein